MSDTTAPVVLARGFDIVRAMIQTKNVAPAVFSTEEGGIRFYWPDTDLGLSVDVASSGTVYVHTADVALGLFWEEEIPPDADLLERLIPWLSKQPDPDARRNSDG